MLRGLLRELVLSPEFVDMPAEGQGERPGELISELDSEVCCLAKFSKGAVRIARNAKRKGQQASRAHTGIIRLCGAMRLTSGTVGNAALELGTCTGLVSTVVQ